MKTFLNTHKTKLTIVLLISVIIGIVIMGVFDAPLRVTGVSDDGILSFELAKNLNTSSEILNAWDLKPDAKINAGLSLGFDFLFLLMYSSFIALLIYKINTHLWKNQSFYRYGKALIILVFVAGFCDAIENIALIKLLLGDLKQVWSSIAYYFAITKFVILIISIIYLLMNWSILLFRKLQKNRIN